MLPLYHEAPPKLDANLTLSGDGEVDERGLGLQFRLVVRVGQLGVQVEVEVRVVLDLLVT